MQNLKHDRYLKTTPYLKKTPYQEIPIPKTSENCQCLWVEKLVMNFCMSQLGHLRGSSDVLSAVAKTLQNFWQLGGCQSGLSSNAPADAFGSDATAHGVKSDPLGYGLQSISHNNVFLDDMKNHLQHHRNPRYCT